MAQEADSEAIWLEEGTDELGGSEAQAAFVTNIATEYALRCAGSLPLD
jgi:hypothetical protein